MGPAVLQTADPNSSEQPFSNSCTTKIVILLDYQTPA